MSEVSTIARTIASLKVLAPVGEDPEARFRAFYRNHQRAVRALFARMGLADEGEDLVQEAFLKAWRGLAGYREAASAKTWLMRIATNLAIDRLRARKEPDVLLDGEMPEQIDHGTREEGEAVRAALAKLPPDMRAAVVLHLIEGYTLKEVGEILQVPEGTVKSRVHRAKSALLSELARLGVMP